MIYLQFPKREKAAPAYYPSTNRNVSNPTAFLNYTQADLDTAVADLPYKVGDWLTYAAVKDVNAFQALYVFGICTDRKELGWDTYYSAPKLLAISNPLQDKAVTPYRRWDSSNNFRHVTPEEAESIQRKLGDSLQTMLKAEQEYWDRNKQRWGG